MTRLGDRARLRLLTLLAALGLLVTACADPEPTAEPPADGDTAAPDVAADPDAPAASPDPTTTPETAPSPSSPAPEREATSPEADTAVPEVLDFTVPALDGGQVVGAELAGQAVALWFWAPW